MNKSMLSAVVALVVALVVHSCSSPKSEIERTSARFLEGYFALEFDDIKDISSPTTLAKIEDIESRLGDSFDRSQLERVEVKIHEYFQEGDTAYCRYTLRTSKDDQTALSEQLLLTQKEGKWLVEF